jgi:parallel beta-helix repeat protein
VSPTWRLLVHKEAAMARMAKLLIVSLIASGVLITLPALAGEGRQPIYQPTVINTPGKYIVTRNISAAGMGMPVIDIQSPDVDVDLNGFTLTGDPLFPVVLAFQVDNVTVRNGTVKDGETGVRFKGNQDLEPFRKAVAEDINAIGGTWGIWLSDYTDFAIRRNNVTRTGGDAILVQGHIDHTTMGTIEHNRIYDIEDPGIVVTKGSSVAILNNRIEDLLDGPGIHYGNGSGGLIEGNTVLRTLTGAHGIEIYDSKGCKVANNVVREVAGNGIYLWPGSTTDTLVVENVVSNSGGNGLRVEGSLNHLECNVLTSNTGEGLHLTNSSSMNTYGRNTSRGNTGGACANVDFCDFGGGNSTFLDNLIPGPPPS